jgi:hypothetical protein
MSQRDLAIGSIQIVDSIWKKLVEYGVEIETIDWKVDPTDRPTAESHILVVEKAGVTMTVDFSRSELEDYPSGTAVQADMKIRLITSQLLSAGMH